MWWENISKKKIIRYLLPFFLSPFSFPFKIPTHVSIEIWQKTHKKKFDNISMASQTKSTISNQNLIHWKTFPLLLKSSTIHKINFPKKFSPRFHCLFFCLSRIISSWKIQYRKQSRPQSCRNLMSFHKEFKRGKFLKIVSSLYEKTSPHLESHVNANEKKFSRVEARKLSKWKIHLSCLHSAHLPRLENETINFP